ncbi:MULTISPECIES: DUF2780 domain-containing protein [Vibrio]|jgi:hypothetical protein|uniref:DUF2780 domain-containing protein n=3 Tax=Vibrio cyclitrophicus TaxID=47951 RepID=A0A7Z1S2V3_9VIBR|nr:MULTISPECIES: DUF2780 domain-containing protein [Vibrio]KNH10643.1 hypothetical protein ACS79_21360 [Vibrio lentus]ERM58781.1 hypothetical protein M565_ctg4P076 [Vibrio cyclitrophicus FF75]KAA8598291.1 hypothetical protein F0Z19_3292 [Vibrio cyclitrophicus]MBE8555483.1 DUF2780 domain-containing protein [Vibrio sp. OPT24]MBE8607612.1 DUF2780 domain-containing protein [Vibrio sp. OPT10]|tara:strand:+ start:81 stop:575 length:495 start_codon:yes stop_codon:yes gene_type:complete
MKKVLITVLSSLAVVSCASTSDSGTTSSTSDTNYSQLTQTALMAAVNMWSQQNETTPLADTVANQASVTSDQAVGGIGSMLALAQNSLGTADNNELASLIPGMSTLESTGLTSVLNSQGAVESAFSGLGMDSSMISTFAPIILQALQSQGATSGLMDSLAAVWQ